MKNFIFIFIMFLFSIIIFSGCQTSTIINTNEYEYEINNPMFEIVEVTDYYFIVYHKDTRVMYAVSKSQYNHGNFTLLVDSDGLPLLYNE